MTNSIVTPQAFAPAYNPIIYTFSSNTSTNTGFRYLVDIYSGDTGTNLVARLKITPTQFGDGYADISKILQNFVSESALFTTATDGNVAEAYYKYNVRLGEEYLSTWAYDKAVSGASTSQFSGLTILSAASAVNTYLPGDQINVTTTPAGISAQINGLHTVVSASSTTTVINLRFPISSAQTINVSGLTQYADSRKIAFSAQTVITGTTIFNGCLDWDEWKLWTGTTRTIESFAGSTTKYLLTSLEPETSVSGSTRRIYVTPSQSMWFNFYTLLPTSVHSVQYQHLRANGTLVTTLEFDVENIDQGNIKQFKIGFNALNINPLPGDYIRFKLLAFPFTTLSRWYVLYADVNCVREDIQLYYQDRMGSILSQSFQLNSKQNITVERSMIKKAILYGTNSSLDLSNSSSVITNVELDRTYDLATNWLTDAQIELIEQLITSSYVWMKVGSDYIPVVVQDKGYEITYQRNKKLQRKNVTVQIANQRPLN